MLRRSSDPVQADIRKEGKMQIICTVDIKTRDITLEDDYMIAAYDHLIDDILFDISFIG